MKRTSHSFRVKISLFLFGLAILVGASVTLATGGSIVDGAPDLHPNDGRQADIDDIDIVSQDSDVDPQTQAVMKRLSNKALHSIAQTNNVQSANLVVENAESVQFSLIGRTVFVYKVMNEGSGDSYSIAFDSNGNEIDLTKVEADEKAAYQTKYGRLSPELYDYLSIGDYEQVPVIIWLKEDDTAEGMRAEADNNTETFTNQEEIDSFLTEVNVQRETDVATIVESVISRLNDLGIQLESDQYAPRLTTTLSVDAIRDVAQWEEIDTIYLDAISEPTLEAAYGTIGMNTVYNRRMAGFDIKAAVIEVGGRVATANPYISSVTQDSTYVCSTASSHSTGVVGIINSSHPSRFGIAPGAILRAGGSCGGWGSELTNRSTAAAEWGARVFNLSWGRDTGLSVDNDEARYYDSLIFNSFRTVVVAAGNSGDGNGNVGTPGVAYNVITVGNFNDLNTTTWSGDIMNSSSSWRDPISAKPEIAAPGTNINSATTASPWTGPIGSGTSYAAPMVTGLTTALMQRNRSLQIWPEAVKAILMASATHNIEGARRFSSRDGAGGIVAYNADNVTRGYNGGWVGLNYSCSSPTNYNALTMPLVAGKRTRAVIAWDQNPSYENYTSQPSADLDLRILSPSGSVVASSTSLNNIFEIVDFTPTTTGTYTLQIHKFRCSSTPKYVGAAWWRSN